MMDVQKLTEILNVKQMLKQLAQTDVRGPFLIETHKLQKLLRFWCNFVTNKSLSFDNLV